MTEQEKVNLKYINHVIRNGTVAIAGCLREIEDILKHMNAAINAYNNEQGD